MGVKPHRGFESLPLRMKYYINNIDSTSAFRLYFFITLITAGSFALAFLFISIFIGLFWLGLLIFVVGVPLLAFITGGIVYIDTQVYSVFSEKFGGIKIDLKKEE